MNSVLMYRGGNIVEQYEKDYLEALGIEVCDTNKRLGWDKERNIQYNQAEFRHNGNALPIIIEPVSERKYNWYLNSRDKKVNVAIKEDSLVYSDANIESMFGSTWGIFHRRTSISFVSYISGMTVTMSVSHGHNGKVSILLFCKGTGENYYRLEREITVEEGFEKGTSDIRSSFNEEAFYELYGHDIQISDEHKKIEAKVARAMIGDPRLKNELPKLFYISRDADWFNKASIRMSEIRRRMG